MNDNEFGKLYNKGNDCDCCIHQYFCGQYGDAICCERKDAGLDCEFTENTENIE